MPNSTSGMSADMHATPTVQDTTAFLRRRRWLFVFVALPILLGAVLLAFRLPPVYQSEAKVLIEQPSIPENIIASTITNYVDERVQAVSQRVLAADNVVQIIEKFDLYADLRTLENEQTLITKFREDTYLENIATEIFDARRGRMDGSTFAFVVGYRGSDPKVCQDVAGELVQLYLDENVKSRTERSAGTTLFLQQQADRISGEMSEIEMKIADFKAEHANALPERTQLNVQLLDRTERDLDDVEERIRQLTNDSNILGVGLSSINPHAAIVTPSGTSVQSVGERLATLQLEYARLSSIYSDQHPDVVRTKNEIDAILGRRSGTQNRNIEQQIAGLKQQKSQLLDRYSNEHPDVQRLDRAIEKLEAERAQNTYAANNSILDSAPPTNPAYIQQQLEIDAISSSLRAANVDRAQLVESRNELETNVAMSPQIEKEWLELSRGYASTRDEFDEIMRRIGNAELAESLELQNKGERFLLLERASLPSEPVEPDRTAIIFLGVVLSIAIGLAVAALADGLDSTVRGGRDLEIIYAATPLVSVPFVETQRDKRRRYLRHSTVAGAVAISVFLAFTLI